jgi:hypothetical protein
MRYDAIGGGNVSDLADLGSSRYQKAYKTFLKASISCA